MWFLFNPHKDFNLKHIHYSFTLHLAHEKPKGKVRVEGKELRLEPQCMLPQGLYMRPDGSMSEVTGMIKHFLLYCTRALLYSYSRAQSMKSKPLEKDPYS